MPSRKVMPLFKAENRHDKNAKPAEIPSNVFRSESAFECDLDGVVLSANSLFLSALGYDEADLIGKRHSILVPPSYLAGGVYEQFWDSLRSGQCVAGEHPRLGKDGRTVWIKGAYYPMFDEERRPTKIAYYAIDITEEKIRNADFEGQIFAISKSQAVIEFDLNGFVLTANENFLSMFGYAEDEIVKRHHRMFVDSETAASEEYKEFWRRLRGGEFTTGEYKRIGKNGAEIWVRATYNPIFGPDGKPYRVVKLANDVTSTKARSVDYQGQVETIRKSQAVMEFDLNGVILDANDHFLSVLKADASDVIGRHHRTFVPPEEYDSESYEEFWRSLRNGECRIGEFRRINKLGQEVWLQASYNPIRDLSGKPFKVVKFATEITENVERKKREAELDAARCAAEASAKAKSDFLANMSHELRTPLTSILGFSKIIGQNENISNKDKHHVRFIVEASEALLNVVNGILEFSSLDAGNINLVSEPFSPKSLAEGVYHLMSDQAAGKGLELSCAFHEDLAVEGDAWRIRQILINLVGNAIKFTQAGSVKISGHLHDSTLDQRLLEMRVEDTGIGIRATEVPKLFERFSQADTTTTRKFGGTGLGLAISRKLIQAMNGDIGVDSDGATGSTFWFRLPLRVAVKDARSAEVAADAIERPVSLLVADDHPANRVLVAALLAAFAIEIEFAENGEQAVALARQKAFDLILMDMQMPVMDGVTATRTIRASEGPNQHTAIVAITANVLKEQVDECLQAGMQAYVGKPIEPELLIEAINSWAGQDASQVAKAA